MDYYSFLKNQKSKLELLLIFITLIMQIQALTIVAKNKLDLPEKE